MKYLLIILLFFSCTKEPLEPIGDIAKDEVQSRSLNSIIYYANQHITNHGYVTYPMNEWSKIVTFTESCRYITDDPLNQIDWNKIFGVRKNPLAQYKNGAYLVWSYKPSTDQIRIGWYLHDDDGDFEGMPIAQSIYVNINEPVYLYLRNYDNTFVYNLNGTTVNINKAQHNIDNFSNGWRLSPNFGGQETPNENVIINFNN